MLQKLMPITLLLSLFLIAGIAPGQQIQPPEIDWRTHLDGPYGDWVKSLEAASGDYVITGEVYTADSAYAVDLLLAKIDSSGHVLWDTNIGTGSDMADTGYRARETHDGGYIVVGSSDHRTESKAFVQALVVRTDGSGVQVWSLLLPGDDFSVATDVLQTDLGFVILGTKADRDSLKQQVFLMEVDDSGFLLWEKRFGGAGRQYAYSIAKIETGFVIVGQTNCPDTNNIERVDLLKVSREGSLSWEKTLRPPAYDARSILPTMGGGFFIAGCAVDLIDGMNTSRAWLGKIDETGEEVWSTIAGGGGAFDLAVTPDGGAIVAGYSETEPGHTDGYLAKVNSKGGVEWELTLDNTGEANGIQLMQDGGYLVTGVAGPTNSDDVRDDSSIYFIKLGAEDLPDFRFIRGDSNRDHDVNLADAITLLGYLFLGAGGIPCVDAGDSNDDGTLDVADAVYLLNHLFKSGPAIQPPFPAEGVDLTLDALGCVHP